MRLGARGIAALVVVAMAAMLSAPASASAAARYASPTGSGTACTMAAPCDVATAVNNASNGDDVTIEPGTYTPTMTLDDGGRTLTIHGQAGAARPVISTPTYEGMGLSGPGTSVSDLEIDITSPNSNPGLVTTSDQTIGHVIVKITNPSNFEPACAIAGTISDSVCWTVGSNGSAGTSNNAVNSVAAGTFRNDTLEATGLGGVGAIVGVGAGQSMSIALVNSIVHGANVDIQAQNFGGNSATVTADHSNFATSNAVTAGASVPAAASGTNQTSTPSFVNAVTGDFHELAGSPTIDAGADSASNGSTDLDGLPRTMGAHTDIGAYEYPVPVCQAANANTQFGQAVTSQLQCSDPSGASITSYKVVTPPSHGTVSVSATGLATYTPASGFAGSDTFTFDATSSHGTGVPATATISVGAEPPPTLTGVGQSHKHWLEGNALLHIASAKRPPVGTKFSFSLNESATVQFVFTQQLPHHKSKRRGALSFTAAAGRHTVRFDGRITKQKRLKPGRYTLTIIATNAAGQSTAVKLKFTIVNG